MKQIGKGWVEGSEEELLAPAALSETTRQTSEATDRGEGLREHDSIDAMFKALEKQ